MSLKKDFSGKVVIITGSSSGIGAVAAQEFARAGAQVVITGRNAEKLSEVGKQCLDSSPQKLKPLEVIANITNEEDCQRLIDSTIKAFGRLDVLVNNAGAGVATSVEDPNILQKFDDSIRLNLRSVIHLTHLSVKHLAKTKGNIVNISSIAAIKPIAGMCVYGMTKCALDLFTKSTALELAPKGIRVNVINSAGVRTQFMTAMLMDKTAADNYMDGSEKFYPLGRHGTPLELANYILFLASDQCSWVTGTNFLADGGLTMAQAFIAKQ